MFTAMIIGVALGVTAVAIKHHVEEEIYRARQRKAMEIISRAHKHMINAAMGGNGYGKRGS